MKEQAAYSLLVLERKKPSKTDVKAFFNALGVKCDDEALDRFFTLLESSGKVVHKII